MLEKKNEMKKNMNPSVELNMDDLDQVAGGAGSSSKKYVEAICEHCGAQGQHLMNSGWTAICRKCGKTINLKAQ